MTGIPVSKAIKDANELLQMGLHWKAEAERLTAESAEQKRTADELRKTETILTDQLRTALADNSRYRTALESIANAKSGGNRDHMIAAARSALADCEVDDEVATC